MPELYPEANKRVRRLALASLRDLDLLGDEAPLRSVTELRPYEPLEANDITVVSTPIDCKKEWKRGLGALCDPGRARDYLRLVLPEVDSFDWRAHGMVIAGGSVIRTLVESSKAGPVAARDRTAQDLAGQDLDVFLVGHGEGEAGAESAREAVRALYACIRPRATVVHRTARLLHVETDGGRPPVQIVLRRFPSAAALLASFDLGPCAFLFDGREFWADARGALAWERGAMVLDLTRRRANYEWRLLKYSWRGFSLVLPSTDPAAPGVYSPYLKFYHTNKGSEIKHEVALEPCTDLGYSANICEDKSKWICFLTVHNNAFSSFMNPHRYEPYPEPSIDPHLACIREKAKYVDDPVSMAVPSDWEFKKQIFKLPVIERGKTVYVKQDNEDCLENIENDMVGVYLHRGYIKELVVDTYLFNYRTSMKFIEECVRCVKFEPMFEKEHYLHKCHVLEPRQWFSTYSADDGGATERHGAAVENCSAAAAVAAVAAVAPRGGALPLPQLVLECFVAEEARLNLLKFWALFDSE